MTGQVPEGVGTLSAMTDRTALWILGFVAVLEAMNVTVALVGDRNTLPAVDLLFTTTGGAILTDSLSRQRKNRQPDPGEGNQP